MGGFRPTERILTFFFLGRNSVVVTSGLPLRKMEEIGGLVSSGVSGVDATLHLLFLPYDVSLLEVWKGQLEKKGMKKKRHDYPESKESSGRRSRLHGSLLSRCLFIYHNRFTSWIFASTLLFMSLHHTSSHKAHHYPHPPHWIEACKYTPKPL